MSLAERRLARLEQAQRAGRLPTIVAGCFDESGLVWTGAAGRSPGPAPEHVPSRIGSVTKTMTAVLVMQCVAEGLVDLADPVGRVVPETGYAAATFRDLLGHTAGLQSEPVGPWWERSDGGSFEALMAANDGSGAVAPGGELFHYSNLGFALLGEAVARLRGEPWWSTVQTRLLEPLGMTATTYHPTTEALTGHSVEHFTGILADEPATNTGAMAPAGQLWSTVTDLAAWGRLLLDGHPDVLSHEDVVRMREPAAPASPGHGLGLQLVHDGDRTLVGHTGSMPGFQASLFVDPQLGVGATLLTNGTAGLLSAQVARDLVDGRLATEPDPTPGPWIPTVAVPDAARELLGLWFWGNTAYDVRWHNQGLQLHDLTRLARTDRFELVDGRFVGVSGYHLREPLVVHRNPDGTVSHLECATFLYTRKPYDPKVYVT